MKEMLSELMHNTEGRNLNPDQVIAALTVARSAAAQKIERPIVRVYQHLESIADNRKTLMG